jgi:hypothetical protein
MLAKGTMLVIMLAPTYESIANNVKAVNTTEVEGARYYSYFCLNCFKMATGGYRQNLIDGEWVFRYPYDRYHSRQTSGHHRAKYHPKESIKYIADEYIMENPQERVPFMLKEKPLSVAN